MKKKVLRRLAWTAIAVMTLVAALSGAAAAATAQGAPVTFPYSVSRGDQIWYLAQRYHTSVAAIKAASGLTSDMIYPGQILLIPAWQPDYPGRTGFLYKVSPGDQLWYLARAYRTTVADIMAANHLVSDLLLAGMVIAIPQPQPAPQPARAPQPEPAPAPAPQPARAPQPEPAPAPAPAPAPDPLANILFPFAPGTKVWYQNDWMAGREWDANGNPTAFHEGNDLFTAEGTPIRAIGDGIVVRYGWSYYGGWRLTVQMDSGYYAYYAHMSGYAPDVTLGSRVRAGQVIGYVGNTGNGPLGTSGLFEPHLHLGIYDANWQPLNPYPYLRAAEARQQ